MKKALKYLGALPQITVLVLFAFFFASTNFFFHVHEGPDGRIVHSHPWSAKPHSHSAAQFQLISLISSSAFEAGGQLRIEAPAGSGGDSVPAALPERTCRREFHGVNGLRAPPETSR